MDKDNAKIRQQVWEDMKESKTYNLCCLKYTDKMRKRNRNYALTVVCASFAGAPTFFINPWFAFVGTLIPLAGEVIKKIIPTLSQPEEELDKIDSLATFYDKQTALYGDLWNTIESGNIPHDISKKINKIRADASEKKSEMNKLVRSVGDDTNCLIEFEVNDFLKSRYYAQE